MKKPLKLRWKGLKTEKLHKLIRIYYNNYYHSKMVLILAIILPFFYLVFNVWERLYHSEYPPARQPPGLVWGEHGLKIFPRKSSISWVDLTWGEQTFFDQSIFCFQKSKKKILIFVKNLKKVVENYNRAFKAVYSGVNGQLRKPPWI